jgi:hypothetical protein
VDEKMGERMEGEEKWEGTCCDVMSGNRQEGRKKKTRRKNRRWCRGRMSTEERKERRKEEKKRGMGAVREPRENGKKENGRWRIEGLAD